MKGSTVKWQEKLNLSCMYPAQLTQKTFFLLGQRTRGLAGGYKLRSRVLRRYRRRWKIERLFAWLQDFRRLVIRYERRAENFLGFLHLGCILILLRYL